MRAKRGYADGIDLAGQGQRMGLALRSFRSLISLEQIQDLVLQSRVIVNAARICSQ